MKPTFNVVKDNHYSSNKANSNYRDATEVYSEIGLDVETLLKENPGYENTCAVRMSLALKKAGVAFHGRLPIKAGKLKGGAVEPGAKLLADQLAQRHILGKPQIYKASEAPAKLSGKQGIVFFNKISGYGGGHIDLIETSNGVQVCHSNCFFASKEVWFWELK